MLIVNNKIKSRNTMNRTVRMTILLAGILFFLVIIPLFEYILSSMKRSIYTSYEDALSVYTTQLETQVQDADQYLYNLSSNFEANTMSIESPSSDEYTLARFSLDAYLRRTYSSYSLLNSIYLFDSRTGDFLMTPNDEQHYEKTARDLLSSAYSYRKWFLFSVNSVPVLARKVNISQYVDIIAFIRVSDLSDGIKRIAQDNGGYYEVSGQNNSSIRLSNIPTDTVPDTNGLIAQYHMVGSSIDEIGLSYHLYILNNSMMGQIAGLIIFFVLYLLSVTVTTLVFLHLLNHKLIKPLSILTDGMSRFASGQKDVKIVIDPQTFPEIITAMSTFNNMVKEIQQSKIELYENKMEKQRLLIQYLQSQIDPHFFSNTLNLVYNMIEIGNTDVASSAVLLLSQYYRSMMKIGQKKVSAFQEFDLVSSYLDIMKLRFPHKLSSSVELQDELKNYQIPPMLVQPLVENCIKHAFIDRRRPFHIHVCTMVNDNVAIFSVEDTGKGFPEEYRGIFDYLHPLPHKEEQENHVGLQNIYQRILLEYGSQATLAINWTGTLTSVSIRLPL